MQRNLLEEAGIEYDSKPESKPRNLLEEAGISSLPIQYKPTNLKSFFESVKQSKDQTLGDFLGSAEPTESQKIFTQDIKDIGKRAYETTAEGLPELPYHMVREPEYFGKNILGGLMQLAKGTVNIPHDIPQYLAHLKSIQPETAQMISKFIPHLEKFPQQLEEFVGEAETPADRLVRGFFGALPLTGPITYKVLKAGASTAKAPFKVLGKTDVETAQNLINLEHDLPKISEDLEKAQLKHEQNVERHNLITAKADREINSVNPNKMDFKINESKNKINEIDKNTSALQKKIEELKVQKPRPEEFKEEIPTLSKEFDENINNAVKNSEDIETNIKNSERAHEKLEELHNESNENINKYLKQGEAHPFRGSKFLKNTSNDLLNSIKGKYTAFVKNIDDIDISLPQQAQQNYVMDLNKFRELSQLPGAKFKGGRFILNPSEIETNNPFLKDLLDKAPKGDNLKASVAISKYRDFRDEIYNLGQKKKSKGTTAEEKDLINEAINKAKPLLESIEKLISDGLGDYGPIWEKLREDYRKIYYVIKENPIYRKVNKGKKLSTHMIEELAGDQPGNDILRSMVFQNPDIMKNFVAQRYFKKPNEIFNPDELMSPYIEAMPELQKLIANRKLAQTSIDKSRSNINELKDQHAKSNEIVDKLKEEKKKAVLELKSKRTQFIERKKKSKKEIEEYEKSESERKYEIEKTNKKIEADESTKKELQDEIKQLKKNRDEINESLKDKNLSLKEVRSLKRQLSKVKREIKTKDDKLEESTTGLRKLYLISKNLYKAGKKLT